VIVGATLRLARVETAWMRVETQRCRDLDDALDHLVAAERRGVHAVAQIDGLAYGQNLGRAVSTCATQAALDDLPAALRSRPLRREPGWHPRGAAAVPTWPPGGVGARLLAEARYRRVPRGGSMELRHLASFLKEQDTAGRWSRIPRHAATVRYRFAVPSGAERTVQRVLEGLEKHRCASVRTVLTRSGPGSRFLAFPIAGWTLAVDVPAAFPDLRSMLAGFDRSVVEAAGRVDLAADSRLRPELLHAMYPELDRWRKVREQLDPRGTMRSDLARRLGLVEPRPASVRA
jgi:decaprenylphospho-beta-D-ribofuranose 2-oxidase